MSFISAYIIGTGCSFIFFTVFHSIRQPGDELLTIIGLYRLTTLSLSWPISLPLFITVIGLIITY